MEIQDGENVYTADRQCRYMTRAMYPNKMTIREFFQELADAQPYFIENMEKLTTVPKHQYPEDWIEKFQAWMEMEKPR